MKMEIYDKFFAVYLMLLAIFFLSTFPFTSPLADEGTHLLLSIFYKDLLSYLFQTKDFSFSNAYRYGINYLVHYPKLQIAYPPLYHLTNALFFSLFNASEAVACGVNLIYSLGSFLLFYFIVKKFFSPKIAILATFLFSFSPFSLFYATRALQDFTMFFFLLLAVYLFTDALPYSTKLSKRSMLIFALVGLFTFLATMGKQMGGFVIFFFLAILIYRSLKEKKYRKPILINKAILLLAFFLPLIPYLLILTVVGGLEINWVVAIGYAAQQAEPTSLFDPYFWLWYLIKASLHAPFTPIFLLAFVWFVYKKENHWKVLLLWFLLFFLGLTLIPNKEPRFSQLFLFPTYIAGGLYLEKLTNLRRKWWLSGGLLFVFLFSYLIVSLQIFLPQIQYYPSKELSQVVFRKLQKDANIAFFSEADPLFSSVGMWYIRTLDEKISTQIFRACLFDNKTREEILGILKENNIHTIIYQTWNPNPKIDEIRDELQLSFKITANNLTTEIYTVKDFQAKKRERICNYICLTREEICVSNFSK